MSNKIQGSPCVKCGGTERYASNRCVPCTIASNSAWNKRNRHVLVESDRAWKKRNPQKVLATNKRRVVDLEKARESNRAWAEKNREYTRIRARQWYAQNAEYAKQRIMQYQKDNPGKRSAISHLRRARVAGALGSFTSAEWDAIVSRQGGRCAHCNLKSKLTVDHIVPIARGGCNFAFNLQGLCKPCNSRKHALVRPGTQHSLFDRTVTA